MDGRNALENIHGVLSLFTYSCNHTVFDMLHFHWFIFIGSMNPSTLLLHLNIVSVNPHTETSCWFIGLGFSVDHSC